MADKLRQALLDGLTRAAADSNGQALLATRRQPGLFPSTTLGRAAAHKACTERLLLPVPGTPSEGRPQERYRLSDVGWEFLLAQVNPKQVLEDFLRILEARAADVQGLHGQAERMASSLEGMKEAVQRLLPRIQTGTIPQRGSDVARATKPSGEGPASPSPTPVTPGDPQTEADAPDNAKPMAPHHERFGALADTGRKGMTSMKGLAVLEMPVAELSGAILARLADWASSAGMYEDCPLPELYRSLSTRDPAPTIGEFHDCLRLLHARGKVYLHPWTGPLYDIPEPTYALMVGHNLAYYASVR